MFDLRGRLRKRQARRLRSRARHATPDQFGGTVPELVEFASADDADLRQLGFEALAGLARSSKSHPVRERAVDALTEILADGPVDLQPGAARELRYVCLGRPSVAPAIDEPLASALATADSGSLGRLATDAGALIADVGPDVELPATQESLRERLFGGPFEGRLASANAYVVATDTPETVEEPTTVAEHLAIVESETDGEYPPEGSRARRLADGETLSDAVETIGAVTGEKGGNARNR